MPIAESGTTFGVSDQFMLATDNNVSAANQVPLRGFRFTARFGDLGTVSFREISGGLSASVDAQTYREGSFPRPTVRKIPGGLVSYDDITISKGVYSSIELYDFFDRYIAGEGGNPIETSTITVYDSSGAPAASWTVKNAWPSRWESSGLNAEDSSILVESLTLVHEGVWRDATPVSSAS